MAYEIRYVQPAIEHIRALPAHQRAQVVDAVDAHVSATPDSPVRNRKLLRPNALAPYELWVGELRVFYDVERDPDVVVVVAVGVKRGNRLQIGSEEVSL